jgi:hypothetical protein
MVARCFERRVKHARTPFSASRQGRLKFPRTALVQASLTGRKNGCGDPRTRPYMTGLISIVPDGTRASPTQVAPPTGPE